MSVLLASECPICSGAARPLFTLSTRRFHRCVSPGCRLTFVDPQPTDDELARYYTEDYFGDDSRAHKLTAERVQRQVLARMLALSDRPFPVILDYGCARAGLWSSLDPALRDLYYGIELDPLARQDAAQTTGRPIFRTIDDFHAFGSEGWNLCLMINVVEHLRDPVDELRKIAATASPGALIWVSTPNDHCLKRVLLGQRWDQYEDRTHLHLFSHRTLARVLRAAGFASVRRLRFRLEYDHLGRLRSLGQSVLRPLGLDATLSLVASVPPQSRKT